MKIENLFSNYGHQIKGPLIIKPEIFKDNRGFFYESWNQDLFKDKINDCINFCQDNHSFSKFGVIRGLHYQINPKPQGKLVRCIGGEIFDVAVDIRQSSETFGEWVSTILNNKNKNMLWIPIGFAHGFLSLKDNTEVLYKASGKWNQDHERSIRWNDKKININWPLEQFSVLKPLLSTKDANAPFLNEADIFV
tara:strand:+ start:1010 stop:1588 length:579 start_codon:yes stop_codon:yes gene_type:complete